MQFTNFVDPREGIEPNIVMIKTTLNGTISPPEYIRDIAILKQIVGIFY